jgi:hypothetical protein
MNDDEKKQLLEDLFEDGELETLRQTSLSRGLKEIGRRRRRARVGHISVMVLPALLLGLLVFHPQAPRPVSPSAPVTAPKASSSESKVEYITAEQLFALFPNRSMALVGKPGHQQLIFADDKPTSSPQ